MVYRGEIRLDSDPAVKILKRPVNEAQLNQTQRPVIECGAVVWVKSDRAVKEFDRACETSKDQLHLSSEISLLRKNPLLAATTHPFTRQKQRPTLAAVGDLMVELEAQF